MTQSEDRVARLCRLLGIVHPIIQGGMTAVGTAPLAAAVSAGGGLGLVSAGRMRAPDFGAEIDLALAATDRPVGVNIPVGRDAEQMRGYLDEALRRRIALVVLGGGNPAPWAETVMARGCRLAIVTATPAQAHKAQVLGANAVVVAGHEAGGKAGADEIGGMVLVPAIVDAVSIPVIATGGIVDGRGAAAAICLGASAVQLGTRFMLSEESPLHPATKQAMLAACISDTMIIARRFGMARRMLGTPAARRVVECETDADLDTIISMLSGAHSTRGLIGGDLAEGLVSCGQGVGRITTIEPAGEIVRRIAGEMREVLNLARQAVERLEMV
ncbi:MAG: nitronate monooxygenase [Alphaproteobacteria bacterium]|nr:nitronate monooxygenase [Alphaproteobacteria bacterium]